MSVKRNVEIIHELLNKVDPHHKGDVKDNLIYRLGYLIGILAQLANDDSYVRAKLLKALERARQRNL